MIILFVNAHKNNEEGNARFQIYYDNIKILLKDTVFYGNEVEEEIRTKQQLQDYLYDQTSFRCDQRAKEKFQSVSHVFIDGSTSVPPWAPSMKQVLLLIKMSIRASKKFHFNGAAHLALYFYQTTKFEKHYNILSEKAVKESPQSKPDYQFNEETGDLYLNSKKVCHSGIKCVKSNTRPFSSKSRQALSKGIILPTKFHYLVFDSKNGHKILSNIRFPFTFFFKGRVFCTPKQISQARVNVLVETQNKIPLAFTVGQGLSTHGLSPEFLKMISNWLFESIGGRRPQHVKQFRQFKEIGVENKFNFKKHMYTTFSRYPPKSSQLGMQSQVNIREKNYTTQQINPQRVGTDDKPYTPVYSRIFSANSNGQMSSNRGFKSRPQSSKFAKPNFEKPSLRCSGPYETEEQRFTHELKASRGKFKGNSRIMCEGDMSRYEIKNYVNQTPSKPPSAHKFRDVSKERWVDKNTFFLS